LYKYNFTSPEVRKQTGQWWTREYVRPYFPEVSLETEGLKRIFREEGWR
jgi:hypothetical protein